MLLVQALKLCVPSLIDKVSFARETCVTNLPFWENLFSRRLKLPARFFDVAITAARLIFVPDTCRYEVVIKKNSDPFYAGRSSPLSSNDIQY